MTTKVSPPHDSIKETVEADLGIIRCICSSTEDDGFTIQCERCLVWQHAFCVNITQFTIPDRYLCDRCSKRKRPKLSKRIPISIKKFKHLDAVVNEEEQQKKKRKNKSSRIVSRYVYPIFKEAKERWKGNYLDKEKDLFHHGPLLNDYGPFVLMDPTTLVSKGCLKDTPIYNNQGLYATSVIPSRRYLMEITGDVMLKSEFKFDPAHDYVLLGTPLRHILFYPALDVCIDTRQFGNKAKYIRRSCHPNAELRNIILPPSSSKEDKSVHLGLFARHLIEKGQEVTIGWNWQRGHISWKENMNWHYQHKQKHQDHHNQVIDEEEERRKKLAIKNMLDRFEKEFGQCACVNRRRCLIEHLKRQSAPPVLKNKPSVKRSNVNIQTNTKSGRRKSSIILLKPKPVLEKQSSGTESKHTISSDQLDTNPASEDELLDVDGEIDIENDIPAPSLDVAPPLLDDHSSDDENGDLSSLASLSSLSVFDDSDHEVEKKESNDIPSSTAPSSSTSDNKKLNHPTLLPRKKLWVRDYLNKNKKDENDTHNDKEIHINEKIEDAGLFDINEGELSDASTILLDEEEIQKVYNNSNHTRNSNDCDSNSQEQSTASTSSNL